MPGVRHYEAIPSGQKTSLLVIRQKMFEPNDEVWGHFSRNSVLGKMVKRDEEFATSRELEQLLG